MVRVGHYRWLPRIVPRVVVRGLIRTWPTGMGLPGGRVILNGDGDEIAVFTGCYRGDAECLRTESRGWGRGIVRTGRGRLTVGVMTAVLERIGQVNVVLG